MRSFRFHAAAFAVSFLLVGTANAAMLTILHNNDGESDLLPTLAAPGDPGNPYGGAGRFVTALEAERANAIGAGRDVLTISSGDNFLASAIFTASLNQGRFFDAEVLNRINYDAVIIGNHEFDFGAQFLADFISANNVSTTFLSANLDVSAVPALQALVNQGRLASSKIVMRGAERYGIVGATTELLPTISSPGAVVVNPVVAAVQAEIDALEAQGVNKIIFTSHLQNPLTDVQTLSQLSGVDVFIAGGYDPYLTNGGPNPDVFNQAVFGPYPATQFNGTNFLGGASIVDADGKIVPIISTAGNYRYLGRADIEFNAAGEVTSITGDPVLVGPGYAVDPALQASTLGDVQAAVNAQSANIVAQSAFPLNMLNNIVRTRETGIGNLAADAYIAAAMAAGIPGLLDGDAIVGFTNAGGIRTNSALPAGPISEKNIIDIFPFANFLTVFKDVTAEELKALLEYSVSAIPAVNGRFGQVGGIEFVYDPTAAVGSRIQQIRLANGQVLFQTGPLSGDFFSDKTVDLVTIDFLANGGDGYNFAGIGITDRVNIGGTYQSAVFDYLNSLGGFINDPAYAEFGEGRITTGLAQVNSPAALGVLGAGVIALMAIRRRRAV